MCTNRMCSTATISVITMSTRTRARLWPTTLANTFSCMLACYLPCRSCCLQTCVCGSASQTLYCQHHSRHQCHSPPDHLQALQQHSISLSRSNRKIKPYSIPRQNSFFAACIMQCMVVQQCVTPVAVSLSGVGLLAWLLVAKTSSLSSAVSPMSRYPSNAFLLGGMPVSPAAPLLQA